MHMPSSFGISKIFLVDIRHITMYAFIKYLNKQSTVYMPTTSSICSRLIIFSSEIVQRLGNCGPCYFVCLVSCG